jgi:signal transduction histidine kinase
VPFADIFIKEAILEMHQGKSQVTLVLSVLENMSDGFYILDHQWRIKNANSIAKSYFTGWSEPVDESIWSFYPNLVSTVLYIELQKVASEQLPAHFEMECPYTGNWYDVRAYPSFEGVLVFFRDITGKILCKERIAHIAKQNLIGQIATGMAHEIRNPLTVIKGYLQILTAKLTSEYVTKLESALKEVEHIENLLSDFLCLATTKSVNKTSQNLNMILEAIKPIIELETSEKHIKTEFRLKQIPQTELSSEEIIQLVLHIFRNAVDASLPNSTIIMETRYENYQIVLIVIDEGSGIGEEHIDKIFDPFYTTKDHRVGLGLSICQSIIERHWGKMELSSTIGAGTTVKICFPVID